MRNTTEDLKSLYQHAKNMQNMYQQNRRDLVFFPQAVREAIIKLEEDIREAALHDSDALARFTVDLGTKVLEVRNYGGDTPAHLAARA